MEVLHARCAGLDISKRDAKVCVRVGGAGRHKTVETVTTWGSMTSQILALREHLIAERITCAVMEATGDYWKPFATCWRMRDSMCCLSMRGTSRISLAARPMSPTRPGWPNSARTVWCAARSYRPSRSGSFVI